MSTCPIHSRLTPIKEGKGVSNVRQSPANQFILSGPGTLGLDGLCVASRGHPCFCDVCLFVHEHQFPSVSGLAAVDYPWFQYESPTEPVTSDSEHLIISDAGVIDSSGVATHPSVISSSQVEMSQQFPVAGPSALAAGAQPQATHLDSGNSSKNGIVIDPPHKKLDPPAAKRVVCPLCQREFTVKPSDSVNSDFGKHLQVVHGLPTSQKDLKWECFWPECVCQGKGLSENKRCQGFGQPHAAHVANPWLHLMKVHMGFGWVCKCGKVLGSRDALNTHVRPFKKD